MEVPYQRHLFALYVASLLIFIRSIVRVVEFSQGVSGYVMQHEVFLYVFDSILMLIVMLLFSWIHPSEIKVLSTGSKAANGFNVLADTDK
jgi:hypothetical protein